jgi:hypothetical protein
MNMAKYNTVLRIQNVIIETVVTGHLIHFHLSVLFNIINYYVYVDK